LRRLRQVAPRAVLGFAAALVLWWGTMPAYARFLAAAAEPVLRLAERPPATRLYADGRQIVIERSDFPSASDRPALPADDLTFNVILLLTLAAPGRRLFTDRGMGRLVAALAILAFVHVVAVVAAVKSIYALHLGAWSAAAYGPLSRNLWSGAFHFYRFVGIFAVPFLLWWLLLRDEEPSHARRPGAGRTPKHRMP
jgi:hypothetical protein